MKKRILISAVATLLLAGSLYAQPCHEGNGPGPGPGPNKNHCGQHNEPRGGQGMGDGQHVERMWEDLGLSADQKNAMKKLHDEMLVVKKQHRNELETVRNKVRDELAKSTSDRKALTKLSRELADIHFKMSESMADHLIAMKKVMTPEQFTRFNQMIGQRKNMRKGGHGGPGGPGMGDDDPPLME